MMWFTADEHYDHANIIRYCARPFCSVGEMDETLIQNHNRLVSKGDVVYHIGDFCFDVDNAHAIIEQLNGEHIFIKGSHDHWLGKNHPRLMEVYINEKYPRSDLAVLCHYAMRTWSRSHYGSYQLFGHSHGRLKPVGRQMDVGVDCHEFKPVSLDEVIARLSKVAVYDSEKGCDTDGTKRNS